MWNPCLAAGCAVNTMPEPFYTHKPGGPSVRIQHPSLLPWKGSVCEALTWLAGIRIIQGVMVLLCHVAGNSNGRELCKSSDEFPAAMSLLSSFLMCQHLGPVAHQWSSECCRDPGSWAWEGKSHELLCLFCSYWLNISKTWLCALEAWISLSGRWCLVALMLERRLSI